MSVRSLVHRRLKIGGHRWLPSVQQSICDPLDNGREISYRITRQCALCGCVEKDWRVLDGSEVQASRPSSRPQNIAAEWPFRLIGLLLKPLALVALLTLLLVNGVSVSVESLRGLFNPA